MTLGPWDHDVSSTWMWFHYDKDNQLYKKEGLLWYCYNSTIDQQQRNQTQLYALNPTAIREVPAELLQLADVTVLTTISTNPASINHHLQDFYAQTTQWKFSDRKSPNKINGPLLNETITMLTSLNSYVTFKTERPQQ
jgi:hypothetical protein